MEKRAKIAGIEVTVDVDDGVSSCWLNRKDATGEYAGSLQLCQHMGGIPYAPGTGSDDGPELYPLSDGTMLLIEDWAYRNGY